MEENLIPDNVVGKETDLEQSRSYPSESDAKKAFDLAGRRLVNPGIWHELCGTLSAKFIVTDEYGSEVERVAEVNDHIKIDIPGLGNSAGNGYDWVKIEAIGEKMDTSIDKENISIKLRASDNPMDSKGGTAHFFREQATSTIIVRRIGNEIKISYHGRNERSNIHTVKITDNVRNAIVATAAVVGASEMQWSLLIRSLLN